MTLAITILTGHRPALLKKTLKSLHLHAHDVLNSAHVILMVNGADDDTMAYVRTLSFVTDLYVRPPDGGKIAPIGKAVSELMARVPKTVRDVMHLEDDWECVSGGWLEHARWVLGKHAKVGQVRLRKTAPRSVVTQRVSATHMMTGRPIQWKEHRGDRFRYQVGAAHFTFNPTLVPRSVIAAVYPCRTEGDAANKFGAHRLHAAQLLPGAFRHLGVQHSLRERTGGR